MIEIFRFVVVASRQPFSRWGNERGSVGCPDRTNRWWNTAHTKRLAVSYGPTCRRSRGPCIGREAGRRSGGRS